MNHGNILVLILTLIIVIHPSSSFAEQHPGSITLGIFPYLNPSTLLEKWGPLRVHLEKKIGKKVSIVTAPSYKDFVTRSYAGEYDFIITAAHLGRLAQKEKGFRPLVAPLADLYGVFVVQKDSDANRLEDLKGKVIAMPSSLAIITLAGISTLHKAGLTAGENITVKTHPSHNSAILSVHYKNAAAGLTSVKALNIMNETIKKDLRLIAETDKIPYPIVFMAAHKVDESEVRQFQAEVLDYFDHTVSGRKFVLNAGYSKIVETQESEFIKIDPYVPQIKGLLLD